MGFKENISRIGNIIGAAVNGLGDPIVSVPPINSESTGAAKIIKREPLRGRVVVLDLASNQIARVPGSKVKSYTTGSD